jgi:hypothetical protein
MKRQPPFAKDLAKRLAGDLHNYWGTSTDGKHPALFLLWGREAWEIAKQWRGRRLLTLLPPGDDPAAYDWRVLRGHDPIILWRCGQVPGAEVMSLLQAVMADGVQVVFDVATGQRYVREYVDAA